MSREGSVESKYETIRVGDLVEINFKKDPDKSWAFLVWGIYMASGLVGERVAVLEYLVIKGKNFGTRDTLFGDTFAQWEVSAEAKGATISVTHAEN